MTCDTKVRGTTAMAPPDGPAFAPQTSEGAPGRELERRSRVAHARVVGPHIFPADALARSVAGACARISAHSFSSLCAASLLLRIGDAVHRLRSRSSRWSMHAGVRRLGATRAQKLESTAWPDCCQKNIVGSLLYDRLAPSHWDWSPVY